MSFLPSLDILFMFRLVLVIYARHHLDTFGLLALRSTWCGNTCVGGQESPRYETWYRERIIVQFICARIEAAEAGVTWICYCVLTSLKKDETAVHGCNPISSSFGPFGVSQSQLFSRSISLASIKFWFIYFLADEISYRSHLNKQHYHLRRFVVYCFYFI